MDVSKVTSYHAGFKVVGDERVSVEVEMDTHTIYLSNRVLVFDSEKDLVVLLKDLACFCNGIVADLEKAK